MKTKILSVFISVASLVAVGGPAFAGDTSHDAYDHAFFGKPLTQNMSSETGDTVGKAAYGTSDRSLWSGHDAYNSAFFGKSPSKADTDTMGKAAYGSGGGTGDGLSAYHTTFRGD